MVFVIELVIEMCLCRITLYEPFPRYSSAIEYIKYQSAVLLYLASP